MKVQEIDRYYQEILAFCKSKNISVRNGKIQPKYIGEIHNFLQKLKDRDGKHIQYNKVFDEKNIFKSVIGKSFSPRFIKERYEDG